MSGQDTRTAEEKARGQRHIDEALRRQHHAADRAANPFRPASLDARTADRRGEQDDGLLDRWFHERDERDAAQWQRLDESH